MTASASAKAGSSVDSAATVPRTFTRPSSTSAAGVVSRSAVRVRSMGLQAREERQDRDRTEDHGDDAGEGEGEQAHAERSVAGPQMAQNGFFD